MSEFDQLANHYDEARGGEQRGDEYAADIDAHLPAGDSPILEIGVGTGVVALGLVGGGDPTQSRRLPSPPSTLFKPFQPPRQPEQQPQA